MKILFKKHTPEQALFIVKCSQHYFSDKERDRVAVLSSCIAEYSRQYTKRHIEVRAARAIEYLGARLLKELAELKRLQAATNSCDKKLVYAFLMQAIDITLEGGYNA